MMTIVDREKMEGHFPGCGSSLSEWLIERDEQLAGQLAANVEIRRESMESDRSGRGTARSGASVKPALERKLPHLWSAVKRSLRQLAEVSTWAPIGLAQRPLAFSRSRLKR
jgi:hypothetical protein